MLHFKPHRVPTMNMLKLNIVDLKNLFQNQTLEILLSGCLQLYIIDGLYLITEIVVVGVIQLQLLQLREG